MDMVLLRLDRFHLALHGETAFLEKCSFGARQYCFVKKTRFSSGCNENCPKIINRSINLSPNPSLLYCKT